MSFNIASYPIVFDRPHYLSGHSAWIEHIPFAFAIVDIARPSVIVELGTHHGDSYCALCQGVRETRISTQCYAVDTWQGDKQAGFYGADVLANLRHHHDKQYAGFSTLIQSTFDEASTHFAPNSIDLLHIDGLHTYEAVKHDFETWLPLLSDKAIVMFHDINVRTGDFGVWKLWDELRTQYPSFSFAHGHGLGVLGVGKNLSDQVKDFLSLSGDTALPVQTLFAELGGGLARQLHLDQVLRSHADKIAALEAALALKAGEVAVAQRDLQLAREAAEAERARWEEKTQQVQARLTENKIALVGTKDAKEAAESHNAQLTAEIGHLNRQIEAVYRSRSWRLSKPIRTFGTAMMGPRRQVAKIRAAQRLMGGWKPLATTVYRTFKESGMAGVREKARGFGNVSAAGALRIESRTQDLLNQIHIRLREDLAGATSHSVSDGPLISLVMPVYRVAPHLLREALMSVMRQGYGNWELCIADDCSEQPELTQILDEFASRDSRIKFVTLPANGGISAASNAALAMASGEFVGLLDNDDLLTADALSSIVAGILNNAEADILYSDECKTDEAGVPVEIFTKPDWSPLLLINCMYIGHFTVYRRSIIEAVGGFRSAFDFSQDYDLALRASEIARKVVHIPEVLYGWRMIASSGSMGGKPYARASNIAALQSAADRRGWVGKAVELPTANRFKFDVDPSGALVSIIVPSDNLKNITDTIESITEGTTYRAYEIVVVTNSKIARELAETLPDPRIRIVRYDKPYSFSDKCNAGAKESNGAYVIFFNDDVRVITPDWLEEMVGFMALETVGIVGPKLLYENNTIQHAGMVTGVRRLVGTAFHALPHDTSKHYNFAQSVREVSLICGACLGMRKDVFDAVSGFDAVNVPIYHSDVDLCFKVRSLGFTCVYTPHATLLHIGHLSLKEFDQKSEKQKKKDKADIYILRRWVHLLAHDPYLPKPMRDLVYHDSPEPYDVYPALGESAQRGGKDVLLVSHDLSESGAPRVVVEMARTLKAAGNFVVVVSPTDGPIRTELQSMGVTVIVDSLFLTSHEAVKVLAINFDLAIANTAVTWPFVRRLSEDMDVYWYIHETAYVDELVEQFPDFVVALTMAKSVLAGSRLAASRLLKFRKDVHVLEYGLDPLVGQATATEPRQEAAGRPLVVSVFAAYERRKGQDLFVAAVANLPDAIRQHCKFRLYGRILRPEFFEKMSRSAANVPQIEIATDLSYTRYVDALLASDLVVVPSRDDTLPLVSLHALGAGIPLLCTVTTGTSAYLEHGVSGFVVESESVDALTGALTEILSNPSQLKPVGAAGSQVFEANFSRRKFSENLLSCVQATESVQKDQALSTVD